MTFEQLELFSLEDIMLTEKTDEILEEIYQERLRQLKKWGVQSHPDGTSMTFVSAADYWKKQNDIAEADCSVTWAGILLEEVFEALSESLDPEKLRVELIQVAAVAAAWIEDIDSRPRP